MLPIVGIPATVAEGMAPHREVFGRDEGFAHVQRYVSGLLLSPNKTLQGIYGQLVFSEGEQVSRRAMHQAVFEAGWDVDRLMASHREQVSQSHQGRGREVFSIDWTFANHDNSEAIYGAKRMYNYVEKRTTTHQTVMIAAIANPHRVDGIVVEVQYPNYKTEELAYLNATVKDHYETMEAVRIRIEELLHYHKNRLAYRKRTEIAVEIVAQLEAEGHFPSADYAFDNGVLNRPLTEFIEQSGKHWVSELECSRHILWQDEWQRVDQLALNLREQHPESFRKLSVTLRNGESKEYWAFTKCVRLKKYGRKRLVIVHERADLRDAPRFLLTDARHWEATRVIQTWSYCWSVEVFHEFAKQVVGFESAQVRNEQAVKRHFALSCLSQSLLQNAECSGQKSERFSFAQGTQSIGQRLYTITRQALEQVLKWTEQLLNQGHPLEHILEVMVPSQ
ncbi:MAG: hypothetical protein F6K09_23745 [Merismopedia sp. SIO2A8]|nr:hypothetical protein [Symploca sp. SIO2B6]NET51612.1 hypothetical protein [Merismopedia sp. SIO2A8]